MLCASQGAFFCKRKAANLERNEVRRFVFYRLNAGSLREADRSA